MSELQQKMLDMFIDLAKILKDNKIKYFAIGGTAIGAKREKGFIEWDDDIDISIHEEDQARFVAAIESSRFNLADSQEIEYRPFYKVYDPNIKMTQSGKTMDMNIDVFLTYKRREVKKRHFRKRNTLRFLMWIKSNSGKYLRNEEKRKSGTKIVWLWYLGVAIPKYFAIIFTRRKNWHKRMLNIFGKLKVIDDGKRYFYHSTSMNRQHGIRTYEIEELDFENIKMPVPKYFGEDSKNIFGDIMKPYRPHNDNSDHGYEIVS